MSKRKSSLVRKAAGLGADPRGNKEEINEDTPLFSNRSVMRRAGVRKGIAGTTPVHDTLRLGPHQGKRRRKTGQPDWFRQMKFEAERRKQLEQVPTYRLEPMVGKVARELYGEGYLDVWAVSQVADVNQFLKLPLDGSPEHGIRAEDLKHLREYLTRQGVPVKWEA